MPEILNYDSIIEKLPQTKILLPSPPTSFPSLCSELKTFEAKLSCKIVHISPTYKNLVKLGNYCRDTGLGQGFLCTKGKDHFKFRDSYQLKDTFLALSICEKTQKLFGFVMWTHKFYPSKHKNLYFKHNNLNSIHKLHNTSLILNLCADTTSPKGTGTLLLLWAMCYAQEMNPKHNGTILFVGKKKVKFMLGSHNLGSFNFSTISGINLYKKLGFETIDGYLPNYYKRSIYKIYKEFVIKYKADPCNISFIHKIMDKYTINSNCIVKNPILFQIILNHFK